MRISDWSSDVCSSDLIDPGAGLMRLSKDAVEEYGLDDYELVSASGAAMTAARERAVKRTEWIVVTGWSPHWMFGAHELRYLERSEERRVGKGWVGKCSSRWSPDHETKKKKKP